MRDRLLHVGTQTVFWLSVFLISFLSVVSLIATTYFTPETSFAEYPQFRTDFVPLNLLLLGIFFVILFALNRRFDLGRLPSKPLAAVAVLFVAGMSVLWIGVSHTYPKADQEAVSMIAWQAAQGEFSFFRPGKYMQVYPNQLGLVGILEALYRITGGENQKAFMYLTALSNGGIVYLMYRITDRLFSGKRAAHLVLLFSMGCVQLMLYSTFLYGIAFGLMLSLAAFLFALRFLGAEGAGGRQILYGFLSALCMGASVLVKNNYSIVLVALVLLLFYKALERWDWRPMAAAAALLLVTALMGKGMTAFYEARSGIELGGGMPKTLWIAMGMQEGERAEGWYNEFNYNTFLETGGDAEKSSVIAKEAIAESLERFGSDPAYALRFYYRKTVSQWNEPTYEALWANQFHEGEFSQIVQSIYEGKLYVVLHEYMNFYQSLIFIAVFGCLLLRRRSWKMEQLFFLIVVLGGFFFHTIWEAKSQYIYPYFVMLIPLAAVGASDLCGRAEDVKRLRLKTGREQRRKQDER